MPASGEGHAEFAVAADLVDDGLRNVGHTVHHQVVGGMQDGGFGLISGEGKRGKNQTKRKEAENPSHGFLLTVPGVWGREPRAFPLYRPDCRENVISPGVPGAGTEYRVLGTVQNGMSSSVMPVP